MGLFGKIKNLFKTTTDKIADASLEEYGELEEKVGRPLYPIHSYREVVDSQLSRGSWPTQVELDAMAKEGFEYIINLCSERTQDTEVKKAGMTYLNIPIRDNTIPSQDQVNRFLHLMQFGRKTYIHCEQGKGRTGCMVAAYRVKVMGWDSKVALQEATKHGLALPSQKLFILALKK